MNILHVISRYWPYVGGSERHLQEISERLVQEGHSVTVFTTDALDLELFWNRDKRRIAPHSEEHHGVRVCRFPVRHLPLPQVAFPGTRWAMTQLGRLPVDTAPLLERLAPLAPRVPDLQRALDEIPGPLDVVHGMNICFESLLCPALRTARRTGAAFIVTPLTHLGENERNQVRKYYTMPHQVALLQKADAVLAQTDIEREYLLAKGVPAAKIVKAGVGVNPSDILGGDANRFRSRFGIRKPFVFYLGTTAYDKGTFHLVQAMGRLWDQGLDVDLVLAGPIMDGFSRFYADVPRHHQERCHVLDIVPEEDKRDLLAAGSVMAMPSRTDSFGIVYLEAWLCGKPVIGALAGGVPEVIDDGEDGFLVQFGDLEALAGRLATLMTDQGLADGMGERGRQKVLGRYTWDHIYPVVRDTYQRLAPRRNVAREAASASAQSSGRAS
ncbi:MAG: glycosyltransferase family 4 protein [Chloroflexota bacterium]